MTEFGMDAAKRLRDFSDDDTFVDDNDFGILSAADAAQPLPRRQPTRLLPSRDERVGKSATADIRLDPSR